MGRWLCKSHSPESTEPDFLQAGYSISPEHFSCVLFNFDLIRIGWETIGRIGTDKTTRPGCAGTEPNDAGSGLTPTSFTALPGGGFELSIVTTEEKLYQFEKANSPADDATWVAVGDARVGAGELETFEVSTGSSEPREFYRVRVVEP